MTLQEIFEAFKSQTCQCGKPKVAHQSFCRACYYSLPRTMQHALYNRFGEGYEEAYEQACQHLVAV